jgi:hypothetical protein
MIIPSLGACNAIEPFFAAQIALKQHAHFPDPLMRQNTSRNG